MQNIWVNVLQWLLGALSSVMGIIRPSPPCLGRVSVLSCDEVHCKYTYFPSCGAVGCHYCSCQRSFCFASAGWCCSLTVFNAAWQQQQRWQLRLRCEKERAKVLSLRTQIQTRPEAGRAKCRISRFLISYTSHSLWINILLWMGFLCIYSQSDSSWTIIWCVKQSCHCQPSPGRHIDKGIPILFHLLPHCLTDIFHFLLTPVFPVVD